MKKLLVITTVLSLAALSSMAQGVVNANNANTGVSILIQNPNINGGTAVKIGTPATAAGFTGAGPGQVAINLYAALASANDTAAQLAATTPIFTGFNVSSGLSTQQGNVAPNSSFTLPTIPGYDGSQTLDFLFTASVLVNGTLYTGISNIGAVQPITAAAAGTGTTPPSLWGTTSPLITGLELTAPVPEPSTIVLGGLGAAALLAFRRRK